MCIHDIIIPMYIHKNSGRGISSFNLMLNMCWTECPNLAQTVIISVFKVKKIKVSNDSPIYPRRNSYV